MARVHILKETTSSQPGGYQLCYQWCRYELDYGDDRTAFGFRFIWRRLDGTLLAARGQARIPSPAANLALVDKAMADGWGERDGDRIKTAAENLKARGCVVTLATAYVGWPDKKAAMEESLSAELMEDARIIREWC